MDGCKNGVYWGRLMCMQSTIRKVPNIKFEILKQTISFVAITSVQWDSIHLYFPSSIVRY